MVPQQKQTAVAVEELKAFSSKEPLFRHLQLTLRNLQPGKLIAEQKQEDGRRSKKPDDLNHFTGPVRYPGSMLKAMQYRPTKQETGAVEYNARRSVHLPLAD